LKQINFALVGLIKDWITSECTVQLWKFRNLLAVPFRITLEAFNDYATNIRWIFQNLVHQFEAPSETLAVYMVIEFKYKTFVSMATEANFKILVRMATDSSNTQNRVTIMTEVFQTELTTSMICIRVRPKLSCRGSDSFITGRSSTL